jgi:hypothetical protein
MERRGQFRGVFLFSSDGEPRNDSIDDECGTDGVEPEEDVRENASAHSYRRYVSCIVYHKGNGPAIVSESWDLWVGGGVVHAEKTKFLWSPGGGELPAQKYVKKYSTYLSLQRDSTIDSTILQVPTILRVLLPLQTLQCPPRSALDADAINSPGGWSVKTAQRSADASPSIMCHASCCRLAAELIQ